MTHPHQIGFLVFDDVKMLDVAGPSEVFAEANLYGGDYEISMLTVDRASVRSSAGIRISADGGALDDRHWDTVLIAGGDTLPEQGVPEALAAAAVHLADRADRIASVCTGAFILGAAGLLDGRRATTHWNHAAELARRYPETLVEPDLIFVRDRTTYTSAGVTAGIDLALALLEEDHGPDLARRVAQCLVVYMRRAGGQSQFSSSLIGPAPKSSAISAVVDRVKADPSGTYTLETIAALARLSPRHLTRLFRDELDTTPAKYVELIRFELAKARLDAGFTVTMAAQLSGFGSPESLRRSFIQHLGISPLRYQRRFRSTAAAA
jgi:transcriptional regulator GlxA family with amidase domain